MGCQVLQVTERPTEVAKQQALAAVGQGYLLRMYSDLFTSLSMVRVRSAFQCHPLRILIC